MASLKGGCLTGLGLLGAAFGVEYYLINSRGLDLDWWVALLMGLSVVLPISNFYGVFSTFKMMKAFGVVPAMWREGMLIGVSGRLQPVGQPLIAPLSGKPALIYEYQMGKRGENQLVPVLQGEGMAPTTIQGPHGSVRLVGFPFLIRFPETKFDETALQRIGDYIHATTWVRGPKGFRNVMKKLSEILADADGVLREDRLIEEPPFPVKIQGEEFVPPTVAPPELPEDDDDDLDEDTEGEPAYVNGSGAAEGAAEGSGAAGQITVDGRFYESYLLGLPWSYKEHALSPGLEVTAVGTYHTNPNRLDVGSALSNLAHGIHPGKQGRVGFGNVLFSIVSTIFWAIVTVAAHLYLYAPGEIAPLVRRYTGYSIEEYLPLPTPVPQNAPTAIPE